MSDRKRLSSVVVFHFFLRHTQRSKPSMEQVPDIVFFLFVPIAWLLWKATIPARRRWQARRDEKAEEGAAPPPPPYAG